MSEETSWKLLIKHLCPKCGKEFGKTNMLYEGCELWVACDCFPADKAVFLDEAKLIEAIKTSGVVEVQ